MLSLRLKHFLREDHGAAAIEAAFIFPFLFMLYFSLQDITGLITFNRKMTAVSGTVSDLVAQSKSTITQDTITDIMRASGLIAQPLAASEVHVVVQDYYVNNGAIQVRWQVNNGMGPACAAADSTDYAALMASGNDLVVSTVCMNYKPYIAQFLGVSLLGATNFPISKTIVSRPRDSLSLKCVVAKGSTQLCS